MRDRFGLLYDDSFGDALSSGQGVDFLEIIPDRFSAAREPLRVPECLTTMPTVFHSLNLSLGADEPLDDAYLEGLATLAGRFKPMWASDHLAITSVAGMSLGHLSPIRWSTASATIVAEKILRVQDELGLPFLVENIAYYFRIPGHDLSECELLNELIARTGCGLLLDINNVAVNAANHQFDPHAYLQEFPLHAVREIHIAGHRKSGDTYIDSHGEAVDETVWELLRVAASRLPAVNVILERDQDIPPLHELVRELATARACVNEGRRR